MSWKKIAAFGITGFGLFAYGSYQYNKIRFFHDELLQHSKNKRSFVWTIDQKIAVGLDEKLEAYELGTKIPSYRKTLLSYCEGNVLETGVGTSRNVKYYPPDVKVTAVDWSPNMIEVALMKPRIFADIEYKIEDVENLSFADNSFDTVVDTFGLEYYVNPEKAISEMKRVCKKDGLILVLTSGLSYYPLMNWYLDFKTPYSVCNFGYFPNRDWELFFSPDKFKIEHQQRKMNGTIYYYILRNLKD